MKTKERFKDYEITTEYEDWHLLYLGAKLGIFVLTGMFSMYLGYGVLSVPFWGYTGLLCLAMFLGHIWPWDRS